MIKTGICNINELKTKTATLFRKEPKHVSITLYPEILDQPNADELAEQILLLFADERGVYKRIYSKRFEVFDNEVIKVVQQFFKVDDRLIIQDVGVSDGRTAVEFFKKTSTIWEDLIFFASDYQPNVYFLQKGKTKVTLGSTKNILEIAWAPFVFNMMKRDSYRHHPLNHAVRFFVELFLVNPLVKSYRSGRRQAKKISLFSPAALNLSHNDQRFQLLQHNMLTPFESPSNIIRAMNVLNPSYFSKVELTQALKYIHEGLYEGGFLVTGSNQEAGSYVHGGVYQRINQDFKKIWQSGDGSSIEDQIVRR